MYISKCPRNQAPYCARQTGRKRATLNSLITKSDQCLISPYDSTAKSNKKVLRKKEAMVLIVLQTVLVTATENERRTAFRICILILGFMG